MGDEMQQPVAEDCATTRCALVADSLDRRCGSVSGEVGEWPLRLGRVGENAVDKLGIIAV